VGKEINMAIAELLNQSIVSSTGGEGVSRRTFDRLYINGKKISNDYEELSINFGRATNIAERHPQKISRTVFRGLVGGDVARKILAGNLRENAEVVLNVSGFTGEEDTWFVYLGKNSSTRTQIVPTDKMISETTLYREASSPHIRIKGVLEDGGKFIDRFSKEQIDQVLSLWGGTFDWSRGAVDSLRRRIDDSIALEPHERDVWFSGVEKDGQIVAIAMAEKLAIPKNNGILDLVETTEWRTRSGYEGQHLMTAAIDMLNAQVLFDLRDDGESTIPLIYAECNFASRSDRAGHGAGLVIPQRELDNQGLIPQVLFQNVGVGDGQDDLEDKLRDFTFMHLPLDRISVYYNRDQVEQMVKIYKMKYENN
jgi:hypothetical protein